MRYFRDVLLLLALIAIGIGVVWYEQDKKHSTDSVQSAIDQRQRLSGVVKLRSATKTGELNVRGWPGTISPDWFDDVPPINPLVDADRPWLEVAPPEDAGLEHPRVRMTVDQSLASFWYNPYTGAVRARVPVMVSDEAATSLYNRVNATFLSSIFAKETPAPQLAPVAEATETSAEAGEKTARASTDSSAKPASDRARSRDDLSRSRQGRPTR